MEKSWNFVGQRSGNPVISLVVFFQLNMAHNSVMVGVNRALFRR